VLTSEDGRDKGVDGGALSQGGGGGEIKKVGAGRAGSGKNKIPLVRPSLFQSFPLTESLEQAIRTTCQHTYY